MALSACDVKDQMDAVPAEILSRKKILRAAKKTISDQAAFLANIPNQYADLLQTVNDAAYTKDASQLVQKADLAAYSKEFVALQAQAAAAKTWLDANVTEF